MTIHDEDGPNTTLPRYADRLEAYVAAQPAEYRELRKTDLGGEPWPGADNAMLHYLLDRTAELIHNGGGLEDALKWLAVHAWFEGHLEGREWGRMSAG